MSRAISLTLSTIIILIVLLATLLAVLFFFTGGFGKIGTEGIGPIADAAISDITPSAYTPSDWFCRGTNPKWIICEKRDCDNDPNTDCYFGASELPPDTKEECMANLKPLSCSAHSDWKNGDTGDTEITNYLYCKCCGNYPNCQ